MKTRTWNYGDRRRVKVLSRETTKAGTIFLVVSDGKGEAFILVGCGDAAKGQYVEIVFTPGGPHGGYWKIEALT